MYLEGDEPSGNITSVRSFARGALEVQDELEFERTLRVVVGGLKLRGATPLQSPGKGVPWKQAVGRSR